MNKQEDSLQLIKLYYANFNNKKYKEMVDLLSENVTHDINQGSIEIGKETFLEFMYNMDQYYDEKIDDLSIQISEDGSRVSSEFLVSGVYKSNAPGLPPASGQKYLLSVGCFFEIHNGKITRVSNYYNVKEWLQQIMPLKNNIIIKPLFKDDVKSHIDEMAKLRIEIFKEYPYFYDGSLSYEKEYLSNYLKSPNATIIAAFKENEMIGAATAILLSDSYEEAKAPFLRKGFNLNNIMYFGDSVIIPQFRGLEIGHRFFMHRELFALSFKNVNLITFFHVDRNKNPKYLNQQPANYFDIESLWQKHRYSRAEGFVTTFSWKEFDEATESQKAMQFWTKKLKRF